MTGWGNRELRRNAAEMLSLPRYLRPAMRPMEEYPREVLTETAEILRTRLREVEDAMTRQTQK